MIIYVIIDEDSSYTLSFFLHFVFSHTCFSTLLIFSSFCNFHFLFYFYIRFIYRLLLKNLLYHIYLSHSGFKHPHILLMFSLICFSTPLLNCIFVPFLIYLSLFSFLLYCILLQSFCLTFTF